MAMNNMNYGYPTASGFSSSFSSPYSSTPTSIRAQRPRFAYAGPSPYPRPRSSASKPNPDSFSDSMLNNFGSSVSRLDTSFPENGNSFGSLYRSQNSSSNYYSCNDSILPTPEQPLRGNAENIGYMRDQSPQFAPPKYLYDNNTSFGMNDGGEFKGRFQKNQLEELQSLLPSNNKKPFASRRFVKAKRNMTEKTQKSEWRCDLCGLDFTSQIPLEMHLRGARHAKKLKAKNILQTIQMQTKEIDTQGKTFHCELCNVTANSSLQLQTHLDGNKHKNKLQQLQQSKEESKPEGEDVPKTDASQINGKSNGTLIRPLPPEFGEPQPAKIAKFSCDICSIVVNSDTQLQQHLSSKRHQAKVEGKPFHKGKKNKRKQAEGEQEGIDSEATSLENAKTGETEEKITDASKTVMGVKTLTSSFVQGETLQ